MWMDSMLENTVSQKGVEEEHNEVLYAQCTEQERNRKGEWVDTQKAVLNETFQNTEKEVIRFYLKREVLPNLQ